MPEVGLVEDVSFGGVTGGSGWELDIVVKVGGSRKM